MIDVERDRYQQAVEDFRVILAQDPRLLRPRLELARALYLAKEYEGARYNFEQVLAAPIPEPVRQNVLWYIDQIRERVPTFAFSLDFVSDSNPKQATSNQTVDIGGRVYLLSQSARAEQAYGLIVSAYAKVPASLHEARTKRSIFRSARQEPESRSASPTAPRCRTWSSI